MTKGIRRLTSNWMDSIVCGASLCMMSTTRITRSHSDEPRERRFWKVSCPGVSMMRKPGIRHWSTDVNISSDILVRSRIVSKGMFVAPICWVMPPASLFCTWVPRRLSKMVVFPASTWPRTHSTGARRFLTERRLSQRVWCRSRRRPILSIGGRVASLSLSLALDESTRVPGAVVASDGTGGIVVHPADSRGGVSSVSHCSLTSASAGTPVFVRRIVSERLASPFDPFTFSVPSTLSSAWTAREPLIVLNVAIEIEERIALSTQVLLGVLSGKHGCIEHIRAGVTANEIYSIVAIVVRYAERDVRLYRRRTAQWRRFSMSQASCNFEIYSWSNMTHVPVVIFRYVSFPFGWDVMFSTLQYSSKGNKWDHIFKTITRKRRDTGHFLAMTARLVPLSTQFCRSRAWSPAIEILSHVS